MLESHIADLVCKLQEKDEHHVIKTAHEHIERDVEGPAGDLLLPDAIMGDWPEFKDQVNS